MRVCFVGLVVASACSPGTSPAPPTSQAHAPLATASSAGSTTNEGSTASSAAHAPSAGTAAPPAASASPERLAELGAALTAADWRGVARARVDLIALEGAAIPALAALIDDPRFVPLTNTADLIYPGAKKFYGHGYAIRVDLDWTHVRAGFVLESLVFEPFGFAHGTVKDGRTLQLARPDDGPADFPRAAVAAAKAWLAAHADGAWRRLTALREALASGKPERQELALAWLRAPDAPIRGFSVALYTSEIEPVAQKLAAESGDVAELAARLVREAADPYWRGRIEKLMPSP